MRTANCSQSYKPRFIGALMDTFNNDCADAEFSDYLGMWCAGGEL